MRRNPLSFIFVLIVCLLGAPARVQEAQTWNPYADVIFTSGKIYTVDKNFSVARALAIKDGKIIGVGTDAEILKLRGKTTKVVNLNGKTVIPGLQDSHIHFRALGHDLNYEADLTYARNAQDILQAVSDLMKRRQFKPGETIFGNRWDQYKYSKMVTRWQLDEIAPDNPVKLWRTYRGTVANTRYFNQMGIYDDKPETYPSWWLKDPPNFTLEDKIYREKRKVTINGVTKEMEVPSGVFLGLKGVDLLGPRHLPGIFEEDVESVKLGSEEMLSLGVTSVVDPSSRMGYNMRIYQEAYNRGWLPLRISSVYEGTFYAEKPDDIRKHFDGIEINNLGNSFLRWRGVKFYADGGTGTRSAWVSEPYENSNEIEGKLNYGVPVMPDYAAREAQYQAALDYGWDLHTHACGDVAMRQVVDLYKKLIDKIKVKRPDADIRWTIEHAYFPIEPKNRTLEDIVKYKIIVVPSPVFNWQEGKAHVTNIGKERMARFQPFRTYVKAGAIMAFGSDYQVTSHNPWIGFYAALTRKEQSTGISYGPDETIGIEDTLRSYTINGAYLTHEENFKGSLEVGKIADITILDLQDIHELEKNPELCFKMRDKILLTLVEGKARYQRKGFVF